jgi:hypothetical protein
VGKALPLSTFTKPDLVRRRFPGVDALIFWISPGTQPSAALEQKLWEDMPVRWIPKGGGHVVKMPRYEEKQFLKGLGSSVTVGIMKNVTHAWVTSSLAKNAG